MRSLAAAALLGLSASMLAEASSLQDLADRLVGRSRSHVRGRAITELWKLDATDKAALVPLLLPGLQRKDAYERMNAAYALGWLDDHAWPAREHLKPLLVDPSEMVRHQARATLGRLGEDRAGAVAAEIAEYRRLRGNERIEAQGARRSAIGRLGYVLAAPGERPPQGVATLAEALADPYEYIRHEAVQSLFRVARMACPDVVPVTASLLGAIARADRNTAYVAFRVLEVMGLVSARPSDANTASSHDADARRALGERLARDILGGPQPPTCPEKRPPA
jgi:HEAT repeat protein